MNLLKIKKLVLSEQTHNWCRLPYPNHPNGCPMYNKKYDCPPHNLHFNLYFDLNKPLYFVYSEFDLATHAKKMKLKHPYWTKRQCRNLLYWQSQSRKQVREYALEAMWHIGCNYVTPCPEALGVNVFATCLKSGLKLDKTKNINICRHIIFIGWKKNILKKEDSNVQTNGSWICNK